MKPIIGITVGEIKNLHFPWGPLIYGQNYTYCQAVERAGGIPCLLPLMSNLQNLEQLYQKLDGILMAGGNDISPKLYGENPYPSTLEISDRRDKTEVSLLKWARRDHKPILAICRGMQMLNVAGGGSLHQDIPTDLPNSSNHTASSAQKNPLYIAHNLSVQDTSKLAGILRTTTIKANSHHHQAIKKIAVGLKAVAWAADGLIEGLEAIDDWYAVGLQCHITETYLRPLLKPLQAISVIIFKRC